MGAKLPRLGPTCLGSGVFEVSTLDRGAVGNQDDGDHRGREKAVFHEPGRGRKPVGQNGRIADGPS